MPECQISFTFKRIGYLQKNWMYICLIFEKLSKSSQALKFGLTARTGFNWWQTLTLGTKLATRANSWGIGFISTLN